jgi:hypothetical protein
MVRTASETVCMGLLDRVWLFPDLVISRFDYFQKNVLGSL